MTRFNIIFLLYLIIINIQYCTCFVKFNVHNKILYYNNLYCRLSSNKLKYTILKRSNIQLSLEEEFEEIKKKYIKSKIDKNLDDFNSNKKKSKQEKNSKESNNINDKSLEIYETNQVTLLNNVVTQEWGKKWIYDMVQQYNNYFPQYMYKDMFLMREYCEKNVKNTDFYIGFFPTIRKCIYGPYYIGAFKLNPITKIFSCKYIIQNPNYVDDNKSFFIEFKNNVKIVSKKAGATFDFSELKNLENKRYYMAWKYDLEI